MKEFIHIRHPAGHDEGWIRTDLIVTVGTNSGQRIVGWISSRGEHVESVADREDDYKVMALVTRAA